MAKKKTASQQQPGGRTAGPVPEASSCFLAEASWFGRGVLQRGGDSREARPCHNKGLLKPAAVALFPKLPMGWLAEPSIARRLRAAGRVLIWEPDA
jgi:hypothetical protein